MAVVAFLSSGIVVAERLLRGQAVRGYGGLARHHQEHDHGPAWKNDPSMLHRPSSDSMPNTNGMGSPG